MNTMLNRLLKPFAGSLLAVAAVAAVPSLGFAADRDNHDHGRAEVHGRDIRADRFDHRDFDRHDRFERRDFDRHEQLGRRDFDRRDHFDYRDRWQFRDNHWYRHHGYFREGVWIDVDVVPDYTIVSPPVEDVIVDPAPAYEERQVQVWVEPVYRTVIDHVWVPERTEVRDVVRVNFGVRFTVRDRVVVEPAHYADVQRQELVTPGHYETRVERVEVAR